MFNFCKTPYKEKRAMVLWTRAYKKKLEARKKVFEYKYGKFDPLLKSCPCHNLQEGLKSFKAQI